MYTMCQFEIGRDNDQYPEFEASIKARFSAIVGNGIPLFTTSAEGLFDTFLNNLPAEAKQHYTCHACRHFVNRYGGLVTISESGEVTSVMWDETDTPAFFRQAVSAMQKAVLKAKVDGAFITELRIIGQPITGAWTHVHVELPRQMVHTSRLKTANQVMAERLEDYRILNSALQEYPVTIVNQAVTLLQSEALYRSEKVLGVAEWFKGLQDRLAGTKDHRKQANIKWLAVATAPAGFCHVKSSMIGTLLDDLSAGYSVAAVSRRFAEKMDPLQYMRPQSAPTQGNIQQAEKIVEKLGIANSLRRRYARFDEVPAFLWRDRGAVQKGDTKTGGVFANITPKGASPSNTSTMTLPSTTMTWEKFQRTILPTAEKIEAKVDSPNRFMALVAASDPDAPIIFRWSNPFSWYYRKNGSYANWNMPTGGFAKVKGIIDSPNQWGDGKAANPEGQVFFLLDGCRDMSGGKGGGFFPSMLKAELHEVRKTLEAHVNNTSVEGTDTADACGAGYSKNSEWGIALKVTANNATRLIEIDRWD